MKKTQENEQEQAKESRRRFLKKAGAIAVAVPVMESLSKEGILIRSAHAQTAQFDGLGGPMAGPIFEPL
ncbi:MAG: twin-arginine translocation signal domain-containing protein [Vicinamibacterales bacterium]